MNESTPRPPVSIWSIVSVLVAFAALYLSTDSPYVLTLPVLYIASFLLPYRFSRDAANIWGLRLLVYAGFAILGRTPTPNSGTFISIDAMAFTSAGLIAGGELVLQSFRQPPQGARFDPWIVSLSSIILLIACNSFRDHIWFLAPLYMLTMLLSLTDLRPQAGGTSVLSNIRRLGMLSIAVVIGAAMHQALWAYRGNIMSLGARLVSSQNAAPQTAGVADNPQLNSSFAAGTSTARLLRIDGSLNDSHLRAASFDIYSNGTWGPAITSRFSTSKPLDSALPKDTREEDSKGNTRPRNKTDAKITVLRDSNFVLFAPLNSWAIMPEVGQSFNWDRYQGPFVTEEPPPVIYYVTNSKVEKYGFQVEQGPLCVAPDAEQKEVLKAVPREIDPRVVELAQRVTQGGKTQLEKASMVVDYLFTNNKYSLDFVRGAQDPINDFILNKRAAHCQYFASATAIMLRAVGIPARYATGYYAHEKAEDGSTIVRGRDAHAWTEAYFDNLGWIRLDA
ncbi:transglutaminase domain-containing protein, partial [bacterium]